MGNGSVSAGRAFFRWFRVVTAIVAADAVVMLMIDKGNIAILTAGYPVALGTLKPQRETTPVLK